MPKKKKLKKLRTNQKLADSIHYVVEKINEMKDYADGLQYYISNMEDELTWKIEGKIDDQEERIEELKDELTELELGLQDFEKRKGAAKG